MFKVVHEVPGRLRLRSARLRQNPALAESLLAQLRAAPGVIAAEASLRTGSLLIRHDGAAGRADALRARLAATPYAAPPSDADSAAERLAAILLERLAERMLGAVAVALI
jgi:hypothetical protein